MSAIARKALPCFQYNLYLLPQCELFPMYIQYYFQFIIQNSYLGFELTHRDTYLPINNIALESITFNWHTRQKLNNMYMKSTPIIAAFMLSIQCLFADSPLTSTVFSQAYQDINIVQVAAKSHGTITLKIMDYLVQENNPIDIKLAVINALGWDIDGKINSNIFIHYLKNKYHYQDENEIVRKSKSDVLICLAYLKALDNYTNVDKALTYADIALSKSNNSYSIHIIASLIAAQKIMVSDFCAVYNLSNNVRINKSLKTDIRKEAIHIIFEYMDTYIDFCY